MYAKCQKSTVSEYYRNSVTGRVIIAWDNCRKKGRSKHSLRVYYVLAFSVCHFSLFNYFKKLVWFISLPLFQTDETETQSGQNGIPKNTEL